MFYKKGVLRIFAVIFAKFLRTLFLTEYLRATSSGLRGLQERCSGKMCGGSLEIQKLQY